MTIRSDISIDWSVSPRIIQVAKDGVASTKLTVQDLYDTVRSLSATEVAIDDLEIIEGSGKEILSATELVGLTVTLLNAKVKFEDRTSPTECIVDGGNLVAIDESKNSISPIQYATNVTVSYAKSSSATLVGTSGLTSEESTKLMGIPSTTLTQGEGEILNWLKAIIVNKKYLEKVGNIWYFAIRDGSGESDIVRKALKDKDGNDVTDIQTGILAQEMASSV